MYIVLNGDLKSSRKITDRGSVQKNLKNSLNHVNHTFQDHIIAEFRIVAGDGFQGMIDNPQIILDIYFTLFEKIDHPFYLGIGTGNISTELIADITEMDGDVFHKSSEALISSKKEKQWIKLRTILENNDIIECSLNFLLEIMWDWTPRRREIVLFYRENDENPAAIQLASEKFGIEVRNVYKNLEGSKYSLVKYAATIIKKQLKKDWEMS
ncbi:MAG TPA: SatD family protein [Methanobacteriaceae archaeon]|nr:SatD family protein [Methanobacteriaceae archaeon]